MPPLESAAPQPPALVLCCLNPHRVLPGPAWAVALALPIPQPSGLAGAPPAPSLWSGQGSGQRGGDVELGPFSDFP